MIRLPVRLRVVFCLVLALSSLGAGEILALGKMTMDDASDEKGQPKATYCARPPCVRAHNVGRMGLIVTNLGFFGSPWVADLSLGWRGGEYLYVGGLWVGALDADGIPHVSTAAYETEFRPGLGPLDVIYEGYEGMPGGTRLTGITGAEADDDRDGAYDEDFLDGYDNDLDGKIDEDFSAVSEQMYTCTYTDFTPEAIQRFAEHRPLFIRVEQRSFAWSVAGYDEFIGVDYTIRNVGPTPIRDIYVGFFVDADAGPKGTPNFWEDDLVGIVDTTVWISYPEATNSNCKNRRKRLKIAFVRDVSADEARRLNVRDRGDVSGWAGVILLGHPTDVKGEKAPREVGITTLKWFSSGGSYQEGGDPQTDFERYDLMSKRTIPSRNANQPDDYRFVLSVGPFAEIKPDSFITFQVAFVVGEGKEGMVASAVAAQKTYEGRYEDVDKKEELLGPPFFPAFPPKTYPTPPRPYTETRLEPHMRWTNPCVDTVCAENQFSINDSICLEVKAPVWVDNDCDPCTPGETGAEYPVRWAGETPPPPPLLDRVSGHMEVTLKWDNLSETLPLTKFEGYRVWKVTGWKRPIGETKPREEEWQLVAEFYKRPPDSLEMDKLGLPRDSSAHHISRITVPMDSIGIAPSGAKVYPVGRYQYVDKDGVLDGMPYFYAVTAFSKWMTTSDTSRSEILGVRVDTSSTDPIKDKEDLNISAGGFTRYAPRAAFGINDYLAVWATNEPRLSDNSQSWDIKGRRITKGGGVRDTLITISGAPYTQHHPAVSFDGVNYFVVWEDSRNGPSDIYGARVDTSGRVIDTDGILIASGLAYQSAPSISFDGTNYFVVWADVRSGGYDIYGARVSKEGGVLESEPRVICGATGDQVVPRVSFDGANYLVVWGDERGGTSDIYGGRVDTSGVVLDGSGFLISGARNFAGGAVEQNLPDVAYGGGYYLVVWSDGRAGNYDIYASRVEPSGKVLDGAGRAIAADTSATVRAHQYYPSVASSGTNYLVTWSDLRNLSSSSLDIYASRVGVDGVVVDGGLNVIKLTTRNQVQHSSAVSFDGTNYLVLWESRRSEEMTPTVRWIELGGRPVSTEKEIVYPRPDSEGKGYKVYVVPNPYKGRAEWDFIPAEYDPTGTKVGFFGMPRAKAKLRIFTLSGDLVQEIEHDGRNGDGAVFWNLVSKSGQDVVSGVYLFSVTSDLGNYIGKFVVIR